jgi:hypothetical protein
MTRRHPIKRTVSKVFRAYVRTYSVFRSGRLSTYIKFTLYKAPVTSVTTYACPTWEYGADAHHLKWQRLQNRVLRVTGILDRCTPVRQLQVVFKIPYVCDYITKLCRTQAEVILSHVNPNVRGIGQREARHRK